MNNQDFDFKEWVNDFKSGKLNKETDIDRMQKFYENKEDASNTISIDIPEDTHVEDFAKKVADILKNEYGTHNFMPFMKTLAAELKNK